MKIVAWPVDTVTQATTGSPITLGDDSAGCYVVGGQPRVIPAKPQIEDLAFSATIFRAARGNAETRVEWEVSREHASIAVAFAFEWDHGAAVPGYCHLQFIEGTTKRYLAFAVLTSADESEPRNKSTKFRYVAVGGLATGTAPSGVS